MRLEQLYYFMEIAHSKSISIAAENLYITQPALGRALKALEDEWRAALFVRTVEGVSLTEYGQALLPDIEDILQRLTRLQTKAQQLAAPSAPGAREIKLNILAFSTLADTILLPALTALSRQCPPLTFAITNLKLNSFADQPDWSEYDMIILTDIADLLQPLIAATGLYAEELYAENYFAVVSQRHPLARKKILALDEAFAYKVIVPQNGLPVEELFHKLLPEQMPFQIFMLTNNSRVIGAALCEQDAVLISTNTLIRQDFIQRPDLKILPLKAIKGSCLALYDPEHPYSPLLRQLLTNLKAERLQKSAAQRQ